MGVRERPRVAVGTGVVNAAKVGEFTTIVDFGAGKVGVKVVPKRRSRVSLGAGVIVDTGDKSTTCKVPSRSCGLPVAGISVMIWLRIFSLIGGIL